MLLLMHNTIFGNMGKGVTLRNSKSISSRRPRVVRFELSPSTMITLVLVVAGLWVMIRDRQGDDEKADGQERCKNDHNTQSPSQTVRFEPLDRRAQRADDDERPDEDENGRQEPGHRPRSDDDEHYGNYGRG